MEKQPVYILKIIQEFLLQYKITGFFYLLFILLSYPLESIVIPQIYSAFFTKLNAKTPFAVFQYFFFWIFVILTIVNMSNFATNYIESYIIPEMTGYILNFIFTNLLQLYENNITDIELGKLVFRLSVIPQQCRELIGDICKWILPQLITILAINVYFFYLDWQLGLLSFSLLFVLMFVNVFFFQKCSGLSQERHTLFEEKTQYTQDRLSNSSSIYSAGNLTEEIDQYLKNTREYTDKFKDNLFCLNNASLFTSFIIISIMLLLDGFTIRLFLQKKITHVQLMAIFITIIYYIPNIVSINATIPGMIQLYGSLSVMDEFLQELYENHEKQQQQQQQQPNEQPHAVSSNNAVATAVIRVSHKIQSGTISIRNLTFAYHPTDKPIFQHFNLSILHKEKVALLGESGSGKSTLVKLIMGYYPVPENTIFIDNTDINHFQLNDLRKQIGYVNQNTKLFSATVMENIQYGNGATREEVVAMCRKIKAESIFKNLAEGLDTPAGIEGNNLSGGQKQIVHILRCIFKKNAIVILDEPTAALDKENKENVMNAIQQLGEYSTLLVITHDDSILRWFDRVVKINAG